MGIWREIGKALNSSIKTGVCIPLNEMIDDLKTTLLDRGVPVSVQRFSASSTNDTMVTAVNVKGKGLTDLSIYCGPNAANYALAYVNIDGNTLINNEIISEICDTGSSSDGYYYHVNVRFNKSVVIKIKGSNTLGYKASAGGKIYFEK